MSDVISPTKRASLGWLGFLIGGFAFLLVLITFSAGPFSPQKSVAVSLGELTVEIAKAAKNSMEGQAQPTAEVVVKNIDDYIKIAIAALSGMAVLLGMAGLIRHEQKRIAMSGIVLGLLTIGIQILTYSILLIAGSLLIASAVYASGDVLDSLLDN